MSWTYRVIKREDAGEIMLGVHEVYEMDGKTLWTTEPDAAKGETLAELREDLSQQLAALSKPVLVERAMPGLPVELAEAE